MTSHISSLEPHDHRWLLRLALLGLTLLVHGAVLGHDFVNFDDPLTIYDNPRLKPPSIGNALYYWNHRGLELYIPSTYTVWSLVAAVSGAWRGSSYMLHPAGFHLANLLCHLVSVQIVFEIVRHLLKSSVASAFAAAFFAVHPLQVEAIAWATGLKDTLGAAAGLTAVWLYLLSIAGRSRPTGGAASSSLYILATFAFALAALAKPAAIAAAPVAGLLDRFMYSTRLRTISLRLAPWMAVAMGVALIAHHVQPAGEVADNALILRPLLALDAGCFYLWKLVWPIALSPDYGRRPRMVIDEGFVEWTWMIPLALGWFVWSLRKRSPFLLTALAVYIVCLLPTLGLVPFIYQTHSTVADRYGYLAMVGPAMIVGWCMLRWPRARLPALVAVAGLAILSVRQEAFWTDSLHLFAHAVQISPAAPFNHLNYGAALAGDGRLRDAGDQFRQTLALSPQNPTALENLELLAKIMANAPRSKP